MKAEARHLAGEIARDSIVTDALQQLLMQVIQEIHQTQIAPLKARVAELEAALAAKEPS